MNVYVFIVVNLTVHTHQDAVKPTTPKPLPMQTISQKPNYGARVLSTRIKDDAYMSLYKLISTAGYKDTSSFIRDAVTTKCRDLAMAIDTVEDMLTQID